MAKPIAGLRKVCLYDPVAGDRIVFNKISATSEYTVENVTSETGTGVIKGGDAFNLNIAFFDLESGTRAQMEEWENDGTPLRAVALYANGALFWNEAVEMTGFIDSLAVNARDGVSPYRFNLEHIGYDSDIVYGINILRAMMKRNSDGRTQYSQTASYIPLRRSLAGLTPTDPAPGERYNLRDSATNSFSQVSALDATVQRRLQFVFPFPGERINVSVDTGESVSAEDSVFRAATGFGPFPTTISSTTITNNGQNNVITLPAGTTQISLGIAERTNKMSIRVSGEEYVNA